MFQAIQKELTASMAEGSKKIIQIGTKLVVIVISSWMVITALAVGIMGPVYVMKAAMVIKGTKEIHISTTAGINKSMKREAQRASRGIRKVDHKQYRAMRKTNRIKPQPTLRTDLRETRRLISEARRLGQGFLNIARV